MQLALYQSGHAYRIGEQPLVDHIPGRARRLQPRLSHDDSQGLQRANGEGSDFILFQGGGLLQLHSLTKATPWFRFRYAAEPSGRRGLKLTCQRQEKGGMETHTRGHLVNDAEHE